MKILVVDDDRDLVELLNFALKRAGFEVLAANDAPTARAILDGQRPDLLVLDVNLGAWNGFDILRTMRPSQSIPVIMLTGRDREEDVVLGLELGADDYMTKPFSHRELIARIRAVLRRRGHEWSDPSEQATRIETGRLALDLDAHRATLDGSQLKLTVTEFRLLQSLMERSGSVVSNADLLRDVWGYDYPTATDVVRVTVYRLRRKLEADPSNPQLLHTVPGVGFTLYPQRETGNEQRATSGGLSTLR